MSEVVWLDSSECDIMEDLKKAREICIRGICMSLGVVGERFICAKCEHQFRSDYKVGQVLSYCPSCGEQSVCHAKVYEERKKREKERNFYADSLHSLAERVRMGGSLYSTVWNLRYSHPNIHNAEFADFQSSLAPYMSGQVTLLTEDNNSAIHEQLSGLIKRYLGM